MSEPTTTRLHIICIADSLTMVNDTLRNVDPTSTGDNITVPLRLASNPTGPNGVAYGGSWAMTDATNQSLRAAVRDAGWRPRPSAEEMTVHATLDAVPAFSSGQRVWLFDGIALSFDDCLAALELARPYYPPRTF